MYGVLVMCIIGLFFDVFEDMDVDYCVALCEMIGVDGVSVKDGICIVVVSVLGLVLGFLFFKKW